MKLMPGTRIVYRVYDHNGVTIVHSTIIQENALGNYIIKDGDDGLVHHKPLDQFEVIDYCPDTLSSYEGLYAVQKTNLPYPLLQ